MPHWPEPVPKGKRGTTLKRKCCCCPNKLEPNECCSFILLQQSCLSSSLHEDRLEGTEACTVSTVGLSSKPVSRVLAVASWGVSVTVRLVRILVRVLVVLLHQRVVVSAVLGVRGQAVVVLPLPLIVVVLVGWHKAAALDGQGVTCCVVAVFISLALSKGE